MTTAGNGPSCSGYVTNVSIRPDGVSISTKRSFMRASTLGGEDLAAGLDGLGVDQDDREHAGRGAAVDPVVDGAPLHHHVAGLETDERVVQLHLDLAGDHHDVVDRVRPMI